MGFSLSGYIVEKPRVGSSNSPFTSSPDNLITDYPVFSSVFGSDESNPGRVEYLTLVLSDGDFPVVEFGWTKNEGGVQRFDFDGSEGKFRTLPGGKQTLVGVLALDSNSNRLKVASKPVASAVFSPFRLSIGNIGSGTTFAVDLVEQDSDFTVCASSRVQLSLETGNLNWNEGDLASSAGQQVFFQQQAFFTLKESKGFLGVAGTDTILLNPIPGQGPVLGSSQVPLLRLGFGLYLNPIPVADESAFSEPPRGGFQWAKDTGRVRFNSDDLAENGSESVYYDGVLLESGKALPKQSIGTVSSPLAISPLPSAGGDLVFRIVDLAACFSGTGSLTTSSQLVDLSQNFETLGVRAGDTLRLASGASRQITSVSATSLSVSPPFAGTGSFGYRVEPYRSIQQFPVTSRVTTLTSPGSKGTVQVDGTGSVRFSTPDQTDYGNWAVEVINGDLPLERGLSVRFFRSPVDLDGTNPSAKDFSTFYPTTDARLADPIVGAPMTFLPVLPIDDPAYATVYAVQQGTGSFIGVLPRLDGSSPPSGYGYTLDFEGKQIVYAFRRNQELHQIPFSTGFWTFQPLVNRSNLAFELNHGSGFLPLHLVGDPLPGTPIAGDAILDFTSGVLTFVDEVGTLITVGSGGSIAPGNLGTLHDPRADFSQVSSGNLLFLLSGSSKGVYTVESVSDATHLVFQPALELPESGLSYEVRQDREVLADRFFEEVSVLDPYTKVERIRYVGTASNSTRLSIDKSLASRCRFRFGFNQFASAQLVATDSDFALYVPQGVVEISLETGNLNFSWQDTGVSTYVVLTLLHGKDYKSSAELGVFQLTERLLALDELYLTYPALDDNPDLTVSPLVTTEERGCFLVRKELLEHPTSTSVIPFNKNSRTVAGTPVPAVFRGGRPQESTQVSVDTERSVITFLPDVIPTPGGEVRITDALPHGPVVDPSERVYIDYYIYEALGGENTITVQKPPFVVTPVAIREGTTSFKVKGDQRSVFLASHLLRIEQDQIYLLGNPSYDSASNETSVVLATGQTFRDDFNGPKLYLSSGPTRVSPSFLEPSYFVPEVGQFESIARGMRTIRLLGDKTGVYRTGVVVRFSTVDFSEFYLVSGAAYKEESGQTEVTFTQTTARQYTFGQVVMRRSVRPVYEATTTRVQTASTPTIPPAPTGASPYKLIDTVIVYRRIEGEPGVVLSSPTDFKLDDSGTVEFVNPLVRGEEFSILYTKFRMIPPGELRASYTHTISPNADNGLANQVLVGSFTAFIPDSFYFRVETMANYRAEVAKKYSDEAKSSAPSGGPRTSNTSQPKLYEQGQKSVFFDEGSYLNEDIIARVTLKNYNDTINSLEDLLAGLDGRVVGDWDGRFKFDGSTGSVVADFGSATNQIDDLVKISPFPVVFTPTPTLVGTYVQAYLSGTQSRFYPTKKTSVGLTLTGADEDAKKGDPLIDFEVKNITSSDPTVFRRLPRARITKLAKAGDTTIWVDTTASVAVPPMRPAFASGMKVVIQGASGTFYVPQDTPSTVGAVSPTSLDLDGIPVDIPIGSTVYLAEKDETYQKSYRVGTDVSLNNEKGCLLYVKPYPPFDGSVSSVPEELRIQTPNKDELLQGTVFVSNSLTAPKKFPALYGQALDDSGDQRIPLIGPSLECELNSGGFGYFDVQLRYVEAGGILTEPTPPFVGVGSLNDSGKTITLTSGTFPTPAPQLGDLVRILDGANGPSSFRRIVAVGSNYVTVDTAFPHASVSGFQFLVTISDNLVVGLFTEATGTTLTDPLGNFVTNGVQPGFTVVLTDLSVPSLAYQRRQVVSVLSENQLIVDQAFVGVLFPEAYRICKPLSTYSYRDELQELTSSASGLVQLFLSNPNSESASCDAFFNSVFTDRFPTTVSGTFSGDSLIADGGFDFRDKNVQAGDYVCASYPQTREGVFLVTEVVNSSTLRVKDPPPPGSVMFVVASAFGVSEKSLKTIFDIQKAVREFAQRANEWYSLVSNDIPVLDYFGLIDSTCFTRGFLPSSVSDWNSQVALRIASVPTTITEVEAILSSGDRLYDKRYAWIDARINLEKGLLVKKQRAVSERLKTQADTLNQLIKLLAVQ